MAFNLVLDIVYKKTRKKECQAFLKEIEKILPEPALFFGDEAGAFGTGTQYKVKISKTNYEAIIKKFSNYKAKTSDSVVYDINGSKICFKITGKKVATMKQDAAATAKQEIASAIAFETYLNKGKHATVEEIKKVYPDCDDEWYQSFISQSVAFKKFWGGGSANSYEFNRDGGFMEFITKKIKTEFKYNSKDAWNPADIWVYKKSEYNKFCDKIKDIKSIDQLNSYLINLFNDRILIGVSLKKTGKEAKYEISNVDKKHRDSFFQLDEARLYFDLTPKNIFTTPEASFVISSSLKGQSRMFPLKPRTNTQFEIMGKLAAARLGKVPKDGIARLFINKGFNVPTWKDIPLTYDNFLKEQNTWKSYWNTIYSSNLKVTTKVNKGEFDEIMKTVYMNDAYTVESAVCCKLQGLIYCYYFAKMKKDDRDEMITDFVYLAKKEDDNAGPFVKIY